jgi:hypothetical protein
MKKFSNFSGNVISKSAQKIVTGGKSGTVHFTCGGETYPYYLDKDHQAKELADYATAVCEDNAISFNL